MILAPDQVQRTLYANEIEPHLTEGDTLVFGHGFNIRFGYIDPARGRRRLHGRARRAPATWSVASTSTAAAYPSSWRSRRTSPGTAWDLALSYAKAIGGLRAGGIRTTFAEETETDLFGEQAVLCGGASQLVMYGFETLIEAGYQPEVAYFECLHELKLIVDLMYEGGIAKQRWSVSDTAEYGDYVSGPRVITPQVKENMQTILAEIKDGTFAQRFIDDQDNGGKEFAELRRQGEQHPIEQHRSRAAQADGLGQVPRLRLRRGHCHPLRPPGGQREDMARPRPPDREIRWPGSRSDPAPPGCRSNRHGSPRRAVGVPSPRTGTHLVTRGQLATSTWTIGLKR